MLTTILACNRCYGPIGAGARPVRLQDLLFHELCAPTCRQCGVQLRAGDEESWSYGARVVSARYGYRVEPSEFWCARCWELSPRSEAYALD